MKMTRHLRKQAQFLASTVLAVSAFSVSTSAYADSPQGAYHTGEYRNVFVELGLGNQAQVKKKVDKAYQQLFYSTSRGTENGKALFFPVGDDMGFIKDIGSNDVRSEGMSYGMMIALQMNDQPMFDKLWKFSKTFMQHQEGWYEHYFAWHLEAEAPYGSLDDNPAPDGELYFAMALLMAENRWGGRKGIFAYADEANTILDAMVNKPETSTAVPMFSREQQQILFVTEKSLGTYTDPSYHVPAFYQLMGEWASVENELWTAAADTSRNYLHISQHPETGLYAEYAAFDGTPQVTSFNKISHQSGYDAFRVIGNIAMDYNWFAADEGQKQLVEKQLRFYNEEYKKHGQNFQVHSMEGVPQVEWSSHGQLAMNATGALVIDNQDAHDYVKRLWKQDLPTGKWRYYDGLLQMFALLHLSGEYQIYAPNS
ncbi:glycosyl hydrolase family 8 [Aliagarivorans taiwanensis]|uniref:glycosyl hydrolase family 8 n=1 Tax=Aliagarivorans taiwanensis TaxID=561966 RepID=UPI0003FF2011|nr:glycosyl hydrolase family 8 [Aliagarivorans taiwanensis]